MKKGCKIIVVQPSLALCRQAERFFPARAIN
jgi:hypothetical protein